ncbi:hypothetical protein Tco_0934766 [Tanacetum coccineum]
MNKNRPPCLLVFRRTLRRFFTQRIKRNAMKESNVFENNKPDDCSMRSGYALAFADNDGQTLEPLNMVFPSKATQSVSLISSPFVDVLEYHLFPIVFYACFLFSGNQPPSLKRSDLWCCELSL